jgi:hypothetical protein
MKSLFTLCIGLVLFGSLHAQIPSYVSTDGLVGWWPFNGNANDESGNGNDGVVNGATLTEDRFGNAASAYGFDGIDDLIDINSIVLPDSALTLSFWIKTLSNNKTVFSFDNYNGIFINSVGKISFNDNYGDWGIIPSSSAINNGEWSHVVVQTRLNLFSYFNDPYNNIQSKLYVDGILEYELTPENHWANVGQNLEPFFDSNLWSPLIFGNGSASPYNSFGFSNYHGTLDDVGIWNRFLTAAELNELFNEPPPCNLIASETQDTPAEVGGSAQFYVTLNNDAVSTKWQTNAADLGWLDVPDNETYSGGQTQNLLVSNVSLANHEQPFRIIVSNSVCTDTSDVALLLVSNTCTSYDTTYTTIENVVDVFDTTTVINTIEVFDTLTVYNTIDMFDTTEFVVEVFDTLTNVVDVFDTTSVFLQVDIYDTLFIDVYDTTYVVNTVDVYDTTFVTVTDTAYIQVVDTSYVTVTDTLIIDITFVGFEGQPSWLNTVLVFPNPASDHITIDYGNVALMAGYNTVITDAAGATVYSSAVNSQQAYIDINAWGAAGVYFMSIYDVNGVVLAVRQIVIE